MGGTYDAAAFAQTLSGQQRLVLQFEDASGERLTGSAISTGGATVWSRLSTRATAPTTAVSATILLVADGGGAAVYWDEVRFLSTELTDGGFEGVGAGSDAHWTVHSTSPDQVEILSGPQRARLAGAVQHWCRGKLGEQRAGVGLP